MFDSPDCESNEDCEHEHGEHALCVTVSSGQSGNAVKKCRCDADHGFNKKDNKCREYFLYG